MSPGEAEYEESSCHPRAALNGLSSTRRALLNSIRVFVKCEQDYLAIQIMASSSIKGSAKIRVISFNASISFIIWGKAVVINNLREQARAQINSAKVHVSTVKSVSCVHDCLSVTCACLQNAHDVRVDICGFVRKHELFAGV